MGSIPYGSKASDIQARIIRAKQIVLDGEVLTPGTPGGATWDYELEQSADSNITLNGYVDDLRVQNLPYGWYRYEGFLHFASVGGANFIEMEVNNVEATQAYPSFVGRTLAWVNDDNGVEHNYGGNGQQGNLMLGSDIDLLAGQQGAAWIEGIMLHPELTWAGPDFRPRLTFGGVDVTVKAGSFLKLVRIKTFPE